ncbi:MAG: hypothetical protein GY913_24085 [Proteobacteria bacterium]|nr:hypothetical protein [Pseudomonadota bacterium]MCP4919994.1 hypothetical protein [Pseudomonadota bacterium]
MADFTVPELVDGELGWKTYATPVTVSADMKPGHDSPEAAVASFYASRLRGDEDWKALLEDEPSESMERKLAKLESWAWRAVSLTARRSRSKGRFYVRIHQQVLIDGKEDEATNEVSVSQDPPGRFRIARVPT